MPEAEEFFSGEYSLAAQEGGGLFFSIQAKSALGNVPNRRKGPPVCWAGPEAMESLQVLGGRVPLMSRETVAGIFGVQRHHQPVARDLCDD